jgi:hypothetical protein
MAKLKITPPVAAAKGKKGAAPAASKAAPAGKPAASKKK